MWFVLLNYRVPALPQPALFFYGNENYNSVINTAQQSIIGQTSMNKAGRGHQSHFYIFIIPQQKAGPAEAKDGKRRRMKKGTILLLKKYPLPKAPFLYWLK